MAAVLCDALTADAKEDPGRRLPPPVVSPAEYTADYFRYVCAGAEEWRRDCRRIDGIYSQALDSLSFQPGQVLIDVGCGRGELITLAAMRGAAQAVGIEYAPTALSMAKETIAANGMEAIAHVVLADARSLPVDDSFVDALTMLDIVEHLTSEELNLALIEARRVLKPGGRLLIHTFPNRLVYDATYRVHRALAFRRRAEMPEDPRNDFEHRMHVNEQTPRGLRRTLLDAGFCNVRISYGSWVWTGFLPAGRGTWIYKTLAAFPPTRMLGRANFFGYAVAL